MSPWVQFALNIYEKCRLCTQYLWYEVQIEIVIINFAIINKEKLNFGVFCELYCCASSVFGFLMTDWFEMKQPTESYL